MKGFPELKSLGLSDSSVGDEGLIHLINGSPELRFLHLGRAYNVSNKSSPAITRLGNLEYLYVGNTMLQREDTDRGIRAIHEIQFQLPHCFIGDAD